MKLYHKYLRLFNSKELLNKKDSYISGLTVDFNTNLPTGYAIDNSKIRRQRFLDVDIIGKNYVQTPVVLKREE